MEVVHSLDDLIDLVLRRQNGGAHVVGTLLLTEAGTGHADHTSLVQQIHAVHGIGSLAHLLGGSDIQTVNAAALALKNSLGLACDPVAGLVEVPCVKRNGVYASMAISAADMALAGIRSAVPPDEVILAMREVGDKMDVSLKETGVGGVAGTPFGQKIAEKMGMA